MFSKELENLIQATLEDGVLEEYEKAALVKRAQNEGVDLTELEIYIQSILQRRKRELAKEEDAKQEEIDKKKQEALGPVCPKCHKQVPPLTLKCDCGYEFVKKNNTSSIQLLFDKISKIQSQPLKTTDSMTPEYRGEMAHRTEQIISLIQLCPVPNTKEDIIEFLSLAAPNSKTKGGLWGTLSGRIIILMVITVIAVIFSMTYIEDNTNRLGISGLIVLFMVVPGGIVIGCTDQATLNHNKIANAWRAKFQQVIIKGRSLRGDTEFTQQLDYYENMLNKK